MAVGQPFNQQFKAGDVIYGIERTPYVNSLPPGVAHYLRSVGQFLYCDEFNNGTFNAVPVLDDGVGRFPNSKSNINANLANHEQAAYLSGLQQAALQEYYDALKGTKYAPLEAVKVKIKDLIAKGNYDTSDQVFRRACKFGLQFVIQQKRNTVHFVLDLAGAPGGPGNRIDSMDVVTKGQHKGHVPITSSELRCCYRNRAKWVPSGRLKFYFNLVEVNPPWFDEPAVWAVYEAHRIQKGKVKV
jgi:hypothetical protein